jgi:hypothetical protein
MITVETIKALIKNKIKTHTSMINIYLKQLDENKISDEDLGLNCEVAKEQALKWLLQDIMEMEGSHHDGI